MILAPAHAQRVGITPESRLNFEDATTPGDSLRVRAGTVHAHRNASTTDKLVFLEFVIVEKGQRSTVQTP